MSSGDIVSEKQNSVLWITLNRPDCGNLVTMDMIGTITDLFQNLSTDLKAVILRGAGSNFCKGRDYTNAPEDANKGRLPSVEEIRQRMSGRILNLYTSIKSAPVPTISVVDGAAVGFGCALASSCDIVLASERARFSLPEMSHRGLPPTLAMTALLDRVGPRALAYLVYSGKELGGAAALASGMASAVLPDSELLDSAKRLAENIEHQPAATVKAVKQYLKLAPRMDLEGRAELGSSLYAIVAASR